VLIPGDRGYLRAMRLLPFAAAATKARLTLKRQLREPPCSRQASGKGLLILARARAQN
jgi:hypothetical protein